MWTAKKTSVYHRIKFGCGQKIFQKLFFFEPAKSGMLEAIFEDIFFKKNIDFGKRISNVVFFGQTTGRDFSLILADV